MLEVKPALLEVIRDSKAVILAVFEATAVGKVFIVEDETPPTVLTVGESALPPRSPDKLILPFTVLPASGYADAIPSIEVTNAVVAI